MAEKKYGRNKKSKQNESYKRENRKEKNKTERMLKTLKDQPKNKELEKRLFKK
jgi:hypothetical protein